MSDINHFTLWSITHQFELVLDMENKAYEAGYKKGLADARKEMSEYSKTGRVEME